MLIGLEFSGTFGGASGWTIETVRAVTLEAEDAGISFVLVPDAIADLHGDNGWPDATILLGWLAASTQRIGLIAATSTVGHQPYNLARRLGSLDMISHGRVGWCLTTANEVAEEAAFSGAIRLPDGNTAERIAEFVAVVDGLAQGWDADALVIDKTGGKFIDPAKMHMLDHQGPFFSVRGPLNVMRSPQDRPVIAMRARDIEGFASVADHADVVLSEEADTGSLSEKYVRILDASEYVSESFDRKPGAIVVRVGSLTEAEAVLATVPVGLRKPQCEGATLRQRLAGAAQ